MSFVPGILGEVKSKEKFKDTLGESGRESAGGRERPAIEVVPDKQE